MSTKGESIERRKLWLTWLEMPWEQVRRDILDEMRRVGMSQEDLTYELRATGYRVGQTSVGAWLSGKTVKAPPFEAVQALVTVFARVSAGEWGKGADISQPALPYAS